MNKLFTVFSIMLITLSTAYADQPCNTCGALEMSKNLSQSQSTTSASNAQQGNAQSITFTSPDRTDTNVNYSGTQNIKNVPSVNGPPLTTSNDTCMGSTSGSLNIAGLGIGGGSTWTDTNCKRLKNARELWNQGMKGAAMALMCLDDENRYALMSTGYQCPPTKDRGTKLPHVDGVTTSPTDVNTSALIGR